MRIIISALAFTFAFVWGFWPAVIVSVAGLFFYDFLEIIFIGAILDMLFAPNEPFYMRFVFLTSSLLLYVVFYYIKKSVKMGS